MALSERLQVIIEAIGGPQAGAAFTKLGKDAEQAYNAMQKGAKGAGDETTKVGGLSTAMGNAIKAGAIVGGTALAVTLIKGVKDAVSSFVDLGEQTRRLSQLTGASAHDASQFAGVLKGLGVDVDSVTKGLGIFGANIEKQPQLFAQFGVAIAKNNQGGNDLLGTLENLRQKFQSDSNVTERNAEAKQLLGRSYQSLLPYLNLTNEQLALFQRLARDSGQVLSDADVERARELKVQVQELNDKLDSLKIKAGRAGANFASNFLQGLNVLSKINISDIVHLDFSGTRAEAAAEQGVAGALAQAQVAAQEDAIAQDNLSKSEDSVVSSAKNLRSAQEALVTSHQAVERATRSVADAQHGLAKAHEEVHSAQQGVADAQDALNRLLDKGAVDAQQVADAERNLEAATRSVENAQQSLADAQDNLNKALAGASPDELTDAQLALQRATLGVAQAQDAVNKANAPHAGRNPLEQQQAELALAEAIQAQKEAQERLDAEKAKGSAQDPAVISAQRAVRDATQNLTDAINNQNDAAAKLRQAQAGDPEFDHKVAEAKRAVESASRALSDALYSEQQAAQSVRDAQQSVVDAKQRETDATYAVRDAQYQLNDAWQKAIDLGVDQRALLDDLIQRYPELQQEVANFQAQLDVVDQQALAMYYALPPDVRANADPATYGAYLAVHPGGHASGGDVMAGDWSWVGEQGPELVRFGSNAHVYSTTDSKRLVAPSGVVVNLNVGGSVISEGDLLEKFYRALTKAGGRYSALRN